MLSAAASPLGTASCGRGWTWSSDGCALSWVYKWINHYELHQTVMLSRVVFLLCEEVIVCFLQPDKIHQIIASVANQGVFEAVQFTLWIDVRWDVYGVLSISCWRSWEEAAIATAGVRVIPLGLEPPNAIAGLEALVKCTRSVLLSYNCANFRFQKLHDISSRHLHIWGRIRLNDGMWLILLYS